jgi:L-ascorbate metabolism protein UlaG (beta-lactamase superfamily)
MHYAHLNAEETLDAFQDLRARWLITTQWGTFRLGNEPIGHPVIDLRRAMKSRGFDASRVIIPDLGGIQLVFPKKNKE